ncbi:hypothetical protein GCM10025865_21810 [Paraoerskovia sediminicola]|uniref:Uncharacterized protein n=1 Tax=Paraoerskovia sediminicola TaxID=1138587 RepID=A0ABM8G4A5_9CELL|nr:hypothetical protein [Paraoerskovia sediminicola]BDZ42882.1 hypothetical protein GCM10025865_21810 [Paraoerskovia sediminicola]
MTITDLAATAAAPSGVSDDAAPVAAHVAPEAGPRPGRVVVCSFYTDDAYYRGFADQLRANLERLGIDHVLQEVEKKEGQDWADICRQKVGFLAQVCDDNLDARVFWIDVDCGLHSLPDYVRDSTADLLGFQRGFSSPLTIGYGNRTRFWEPCFFGVGTSKVARRWIADAAALERTSAIKATDDYFFEEAWRAHATTITFQIIPSVAVTGRSAGSESGVEPFFTFGSSGNVDEFKGTVAQHGHVGGVGRNDSVWTRGRRSALRTAKSVERALPARLADPMRRAADRLGVTHTLTGGGADALSGLTRGPGSSHRVRIVREMLVAGQAGRSNGWRAPTTGSPRRASPASPRSRPTRLRGPSRTSPRRTRDRTPSVSRGGRDRSPATSATGSAHSC